MSDDDTSRDEQSETPTGQVNEVSDEQLPEELRPDEDNPLARHPEETGDSDDAIGEDREGGPETAPLTAEESDYGESGQG